MSNRRDKVAIFGNLAGWYLNTPVDGWYMQFLPEKDVPAWVMPQSVIDYLNKVEEGAEKAAQAFADGTLFVAPIPEGDAAAALVESVFGKNSMMLFQEATAYFVEDAKHLIQLLDLVAKSVLEDIAHGVPAVSASAEVGDMVQVGDTVQSGGNNSAFTIEFDNHTASIPLNRKDLVIEKKVLIQTSVQPGTVLETYRSQTLSYGYSSLTDIGKHASDCSVTWELADKSWWFGVDIHVPVKVAGIGTWPYYQIASANNDGHKSGWWRPVQHASQPWEIIPDKGTDHEKWKVVISTVSEGSALYVTATIVDIRPS
ncbi:hypothetical protein CALVIDRAFT_563879 [Calocera viscosa TUFC12733]|uniref:Uncharacterized protein n=1 Tax=Calocera viscosa (strain TUFC12733) TaxID=1330018 RepID=A0A167M6E4_CALVF|nr:hypothetical protein CALVIDRAFT_563879 [Calocera viscosa TUFC12733]